MANYNQTDSWQDRDTALTESRRMRHNGHRSTQDFENENATRYNRGREGDQDLHYREYSPRDYREDFGSDVNYGERYGFSGYGRSRYDPDINRGWQDDRSPDDRSWNESSMPSWSEGQPFTNREQDYRGGRWNRASQGYDRDNYARYSGRSDYAPSRLGGNAWNPQSVGYAEPSSRDYGDFRGGSSSERGIPSGTEQFDGAGSNRWSSQRPFTNERLGGRAMSGYGTMGQYGRGPYSGIGPKNYRRNDSRIEEDVCERLMDHPEINASNIEVKVMNGEVTLSGTVDDRNTKRMAEDVLESISGVRDVNNQIRVSSSIGNGSGLTSEHTNGHAPNKQTKMRVS
ncbi:MAG TPA: BON domain-containing protein [Candidatus Kapabacteria bacterium]|nr:BON domain-containing protein [Candidatus Kapabacteria bacterium]